MEAAGEKVVTEVVKGVVAEEAEGMVKKGSAGKIGRRRRRRRPSW
jgi:hypothetical protein